MSDHESDDGQDSQDYSEDSSLDYNYLSAELDLPSYEDVQLTEEAHSLVAGNNLPQFKGPDVPQSRDIGSDNSAHLDLELAVRSWLRAHAASYDVASNSFYWQGENYSARALADVLHASLLFLGKRQQSNLWHTILKEVGRAKRRDAIQLLRNTLCKSPRCDDTQLRAWLGEMLQADIEPEEFENCVTVLKQWLWLVQRQLIGEKQTWHMMPIFWGGQGGGKSTQVGNLLRPLGSFSQEATFQVFIGQFDTMPMHWSFALFLDEMEAADRTENTAVKRAISSDYVPGRAMYSDDGRRIRRNASFIACTNLPPPHGLKDTTGARRFYSFECRSTPVTGARKAFFDGIDYGAIWRSVDPHGPAPVLARREQIAERQNTVNRSQSLYEEFIAEQFVLVLNADNEPDRRVRYRVRDLSRALRRYIEDRKLANVVPSQSQLKMELQALGMKVINPDNVLTVLGLRPRDGSSVADADMFNSDDSDD